MSALRFEVLARCAASRARLGRVTTPLGAFDTPAFMPVATAVSLLAIALGFRRRGWLFATVDDDPAWMAAIGGCAAVGVGGAIFNDSGPVLLIIATFVAACAILYLRGRPLAADGSGR